MSFLSSFFRCLCLCMVIEKGTWYPNEKPKSSRHNEIKKHLYKQKPATIDKKNKNRPAWMREWTISKGWVHNKSHMLELGIKNPSEKMDNKTYENLSETSSISSQNIDELVSLESNVDTRQKWNQVARRTDASEVETEGTADYSSDEDETIRISSKISKEDAVSLFEKVSENYRENFPEPTKNYVLNTFDLPQVYKEQLLLRENKHMKVIRDLWKHFKLKRNNPVECRYTENQLFDNKDIFNPIDSPNTVGSDTETKTPKKTNLAKNIALYNDLNSRTNLHEETIYECSEENSNHTSLNNVYYNPIYSQETNKQISLYDRRMEQYQHHLKYFHENNNLSRLRSDKYVIRHIRVRIMLSLRVGKVQKTKQSRDKKRTVFGGKRKVSRSNDDDGDAQSRVAKIHEEQRRIGNGKTSIKIQNMRYE